MAKESLLDVTVRNAKPGDKDKRLNDGNGLYLLIKPNGAKWWRFDYSIEGKRKTLSLGTFPAISLADARRKAEEGRAKVANGVDPSDTRKEIKAAKKIEAENQKRIDAGLPVLNSFEHVAREWLASLAHTVTDKTHQKKVRRFELHVFPSIGRMGVAAIKSPDIYSLLKPLIAKEELETAHRLHSEIQRCIRLCNRAWLHRLRRGASRSRADTSPEGKTPRCANRSEGSRSNAQRHLQL